MKIDSLIMATYPGVPPAGISFPRSPRGHSSARITRVGNRTPPPDKITHRVRIGKRKLLKIMSGLVYKAGKQQTGAGRAVSGFLLFATKPVAQTACACGELSLRGRISARNVPCEEYPAGTRTGQDLSRRLFKVGSSY